MADHPHAGPLQGNLDHAGDGYRLCQQLGRRGVEDRGSLPGQGGVKHPVNAPYHPRASNGPGGGLNHGSCV